MTSMVVLVTGQLLVSRCVRRDRLIVNIIAFKVDDSTNPIHFSQMFYLIPDGQSFYV